MILCLLLRKYSHLVSHTSKILTSNLIISCFFSNWPYWFNFLTFNIYFWFDVNNCWMMVQWHLLFMSSLTRWGINSKESDYPYDIVFLKKNILVLLTVAEVWLPLWHCCFFFSFANSCWIGRWNLLHMSLFMEQGDLTPFILLSFIILLLRIITIQNLFGSYIFKSLLNY